jgi:hypothetical protein
MKRLLFALPLLLLCGCMAKIVKELAKDPATVHLQIMVPMYGSMILDRSYPTNYVQKP